MQPNAHGHNVIIINIINALLGNNTELSPKLTNEKPAHMTPTSYAPIAAARSR